MGQVQRLHLNAAAKSIADPGHLLAGQIHVEDQPRQAGGRVTQSTAKGVHHALQSGTHSRSIDHSASVRYKRLEIELFDAIEPTSGHRELAPNHWSFGLNRWHGSVSTEISHSHLLARGFGTELEPRSLEGLNNRVYGYLV